MPHKQRPKLFSALFVGLLSMREPMILESASSTCTPRLLPKQFVPFINSNYFEVF